MYSTDVSEDMVKLASSKASTLPNCQCRVADGQDLSAWADGSVDVVTCCYGYMFPSDKVKALSEAYRVLKPGGTLIATSWSQLEVTKLAAAIMGGVLGGPPPPPLDHMNPLSLKNPGDFDALAAAAGFDVAAAAAATVSSEYPFDFGTDEDMQFKMSTLVFKAKLDALDPAPHPKARAAFAAHKDEYFKLDPLSGSMVVHNNVFVMATLVK